ncbi:PglL family O-oligosaccharyltransferase [Sedimenticola hydrogenitrophicus]|uniref:PglL family O-oligosaccharyltransferase n=1 Tax=Sedimenticola hydrogenitrophicus TaxID=2967975 RepID=UPI0021A5F43E|nr:O-antigen ligase family protein [Sedimenticola hydrogenitrophicus]
MVTIAAAILRFFKSTAPIWAVFSVLLIAIGWLLPNHTMPWTSFHQEAWISLAFLPLGLIGIIKAPAKFPLDWFGCLLVTICTIPLIQFAFGEIAFFGSAWLSSLYLLGFLGAFFVGRFWNLDHQWQIVDLLCLAIAVASVISVFLQLYQFFQLDGLRIWVIDTPGRYPAANVAQQNQLATLLLLGVVSVFWARIRVKISWFLAAPVLLLLGMGLALTGSRTAGLGVAVIVAAFWYWGRLWTDKKIPWVALLFAIYTLICAFLINWFYDILQGDGGLVQSQISKAVSDPRITIWKLLTGALMERPLWGYGWGNVAEAHIFEALNYPPLHIVFSSSHNLFLDILLWCGIPIGGFIIISLVFWLYRQFRRVNTAERAVSLCFLLVVGNHSMLEYPLQYAYFLLPVGAIAGALSVSRGGDAAIVWMRKRYVVLMVLSLIVALVITIADYFKVEHSYRLLRMEWAGLTLDPDAKPPSVLALTQWNHVIKLARMSPRRGMSDDELEELRNVALYAHKPLDFRNISYSLVLNGRKPEGEIWLNRLCSVGLVKNCELSRQEFKAISANTIKN